MPETPTISTPASAAPSAPATTTVSSPASSADLGANLGLDGSIDALLATPSHDDPPADPIADTPASPDPTPEAPKTPEVAATPEAEADADADVEDDSDLDAAQATTEPTPNLLDLKKPRGQRIYGAYKAYKELTEALGHEPNVEELNDYRAAYSDRLAMEAEFTSGNPAEAANWLDYWHGASPEGMTNVAQQLPDYLASKNQAAYVRMAVPVINRYIQGMYNLAAAEANPDQQKALLYTAQMMDWHMNNRFRDGAAVAAAKADPLAQREQAVNQRFQQVQNWEQQQAQARMQAWNTSLESAQQSALETAAEPILAKLETALSPRLAQAAANDFGEAVLAHMAKDAEGQRIYEIERQRAAQSLSSTDALAAKYAQRVARAVRAVGPSFLKEAGLAAQQQATARHTALASAAEAGKAPTSSGPPRPQSILPPTQAQYASRSEQMESEIDRLLGATGRR